MNRSERVAAFSRIDLYPVTCENLSGGRTNLEVLEGIIAGGAGIVQLREKDLGDGSLFRQAETFRRLTAAHGVLLVINDRVDIALAVGADGVHLGQGDLPVDAARRIAPDLLIGASTHSREEAFEAGRLGADYVNIGPLFQTGTKEGLQSFLGPEAIAEIGAGLDLPFTVMGGITESNIGLVLEQGARKVAVVTAVTQAKDIAGRVRRLRDLIRQASEAP